MEQILFDQIPSAVGKTLEGEPVLGPAQLLGEQSQTRTSLAQAVAGKLGDGSASLNQSRRMAARG
jgi:hypothetical protein